MKSDWISFKIFGKVYFIVYGLDEGFRKCFKSCLIVRRKIYVGDFFFCYCYGYANYFGRVFIFVSIDVNVKIRKGMVRAWF